MSEETPEVLYPRAVAGDRASRDTLILSHPAWVFRQYMSGDKQIVELLRSFFEPAAKLHIDTKLARNRSLQRRFETLDVLQDAYSSLLNRFKDPTASAMQRYKEEFDATETKKVDTFAELKAWFFRVVDNKYVDLVRFHTNEGRDPNKEVRLRDSGTASSAPGIVLQADQSTVSSIINREERNERLRREIDRLPEELRQVANLRFIDDIAVSKISDLLKIDNFSRVNSMVKKAKEILQKNLGQDFLN